MAGIVCYFGRAARRGRVGRHTSVKIHRTDDLRPDGAIWSNVAATQRNKGVGGLVPGESGREQAAAPIYRIGEMAQHTGLTVRAIRLYEEEGLLRPSLHVRGANRLYNSTDLERLKQIAGLRDVGFSIAEIRTILEDDALRRQLQARYLATADPAERRRLIVETMTLSEQLIAALERRSARVQALLHEEQARLQALRERRDGQ